jgi:hypothetical protein
MRFAVRLLVSAAAAALACPAASSSAGDLPPGATRNGNNEDDSVSPLPDESQWKGERLGQQSSPFEFNGKPYEDTGQPRFSRGTFTSEVYRDAGTGGLAFLYTLDETAHNGVMDLEHVGIKNFGPYSTDVYFTFRDFGVTRSADGSTLDYFFNVEDAEGQFLIRTNAPSYARNGTFDIRVEFQSGEGTDGATFNAYAPLPVPEPAGAAALSLAVGAAFLRRRKR